jgi:hypothetical protein
MLHKDPWHGTHRQPWRLNIVSVVSIGITVGLLPGLERGRYCLRPRLFCTGVMSHFRLEQTVLCFPHAVCLLARRVMKCAPTSALVAGRGRS